MGTTRQNNFGHRNKAYLASFPNKVKYVGRLTLKFYFGFVMICTYFVLS